MGDLKKKKPKEDIKTDYNVDRGNEKKILIENEETFQDEEIIERLRGYIQKFYEIQVEKLEKEEQKKYDLNKKKKEE